MGILEDIDSAAYDIMAGRVDFDALYRACRADNAPALINVREVA